MSAPRDITPHAVAFNAVWEKYGQRDTYRTAAIADSVLDALAEAGFVLVERPVDGSDRVIRWETTTCPECEGGAVFFGLERVCPACDGSGRGPETVTLSAVETPDERRARFKAENDRIWGEGNWIQCRTCPPDYNDRLTYHHKNMHRVVPVDTSVPAEPKEKP